MSDELPIQMFARRPRRAGFKAGGVPTRKVLLSLPVALLDRLDACALATLRTRSAEVECRLEASMANESIDAHGVIVVHSPTPLK